MTSEYADLALSSETAKQIRFILEKLFRDGKHWVRGISTTDWRRIRYAGDARAARRVAADTGPSTANVITEIQLVYGYLAMHACSETESMHNYIVVRADSQCIDSNAIALVRPVLKVNFENKPQLNFHVWFHCLPPSGQPDHLMTGWRLEAPEGGGSAHDFFHAQPLRRHGPNKNVHGLCEHFSERFPTIPLPASNTVELCLTTVLVACGKDALRELVRNSGDADVREAAKAFWTKLFGDAGSSNVVTAAAH